MALQKARKTETTIREVRGKEVKMLGDSGTTISQDHKDLHVRLK